MTSISSSYQNNYQVNYQKQIFKKLDENSDGSVSKDEFVNGRPKDVTADQAGSIFDKIDSKKTGSISETDFANAAPPPRPGVLDSYTLESLLQGQDTSQNGDSSSDESRSAGLFAKTDADGNGTVSKEEFVKARPKNVSADQATSHYNKIDSSGTNVLTADQLKASLKANRPPQGLDPHSFTNGSNEDTGLQALLEALKNSDGGKKAESAQDTSKGSTSGSSDNSIAEFLRATRSYSFSKNYGVNDQASTLLASA